MILHGIFAIYSMPMEPMLAYYQWGLETTFSIQNFSQNTLIFYTKMHLKKESSKWRPLDSALNALNRKQMDITMLCVAEDVMPIRFIGMI